MKQLPIGSVLVAPKGLGFVMHKVVVVGVDAIFHNAPGRGEHLSSLNEFLRSNPTAKVIYVPQSTMEVHAILGRVRNQLAAPREYDVWNYNCDHAAAMALGWPCESPQLQTWAKVAAGAAFLAMIARA